MQVLRRAPALWDCHCNRSSRLIGFTHQVVSSSTGWLFFRAAYRRIRHPVYNHLSTLFYGYCAGKRQDSLIFPRRQGPFAGSADYPRTSIAGWKYGEKRGKRNVVRYLRVCRVVWPRVRGVQRILSLGGFQGLRRIFSLGYEGRGFNLGLGRKPLKVPCGAAQVFRAADVGSDCSRGRTALGVSALALGIALAGCGAYRPVVTPVTPTGPASQPQSFVMVTTTTGTSGNYPLRSLPG